MKDYRRGGTRGTKKDIEFETKRVPSEIDRRRKEQIECVTPNKVSDDAEIRGYVNTEFSFIKWGSA